MTNHCKLKERRKWLNVFNWKTKVNRQMFKHKKPKQMSQMIRLKAKANDWDDQQMFWPFHRSSALQSGWLPRLQRFRCPASVLLSTHPSTHLKIDFRLFNYSSTSLMYYIHQKFLKSKLLAGLQTCEYIFFLFLYIQNFRSIIKGTAME